MKTDKQEQEEKIFDELYEKLEESNYTNSLDVILWPYTDAIWDTLKSWDDLTKFLHDAFKNMVVNKINEYIQWYFRRKEILKKIDKNNIIQVMSLIEENKDIFKSDEDVKILKDFIKWKYDVISISHPFDENRYLSIKFDNNYFVEIFSLMMSYLKLSNVIASNSGKGTALIDLINNGQREKIELKKLNVVVWDKQTPIVDMIFL